MSKNNSLSDFFTRFNRALKRQQLEELKLDHKDINEKPILKTHSSIEKQMSEIYTQHIFYKFQEELWHSIAYILILEDDDEHHLVHTIQRSNREGGVRRLTHKRNIDYVKFSCRLFESKGIPRRHMLTYFMRINYVSEEID